MLAAAVYACERLFMEQADKSVLCRNLFHYFHCELVVVGCDVGGCKYGSKLVLSRRYFVVLCLCENTEFPQLLVKVFHVCRNSRLDCAEVMVVHFLTFGRHCAEQCSSAEEKVFSLVKVFLVYKEVFLFGTYGRIYASCGGVSEEL